MAITRTPIINDDGTCTTGTVWDNAWKTELYDQIDAMAATVQAPMKLGPMYRAAPGAGQINDWNLASLGKYTAFLISPVGGALTVTGIVAQPDSTMYLLVNASQFVITLSHYSGLSGTLNRFFGPGNASYTMQPWYSVWLLYDAINSAWIILKA